MKFGRYQNEKGKDNQGEDQASQNDLFANAHHLLVSCHLDTRTPQLCTEAEHIVHNEDKGKPFGAHA